MIRYPDKVLFSDHIQNRLTGEACFEGACGMAHKAYYWVVTQKPSTGKIIFMKNYDTVGFDVDPHEMQQMFAGDLAKRLMKQASMGGGWIVGFTHPPHSSNAMRIDGDNAWNRLIMLWLNESGDVQFTVESEIQFISMIENGAARYVGMCEEAWSKWDDIYGKKAMKEDFGIKDHQVLHLAQGETRH